MSRMAQRVALTLALAWSLQAAPASASPADRTRWIGDDGLAGRSVFARVAELVERGVAALFGLDEVPPPPPPAPPEGEGGVYIDPDGVP